MFLPAHSLMQQQNPLELNVDNFFQHKYQQNSFWESEEQ